MYVQFLAILEYQLTKRLASDFNLSGADLQLVLLIGGPWQAEDRKPGTAR